LDTDARHDREVFTCGSSLPIQACRSARSISRRDGGGRGLLTPFPAFAAVDLGRVKI
jgi:hypothetical protein